MENQTRRSFVQTAAGIVATAVSVRRVRGANERIRLGIIGTGSRGSYLMSELNKLPDIDWTAVCDCYDVRREQAAAKLTGGKAVAYADYRQLLDRKDIDGVVVAAPDHWHSRMTIDACRAGKDVYVEKPMTSVAYQGPAVVRAARESKRIVQVGVQQRSGPHFIEAKRKFIDSGLIGKITLVRTWWNGNGGYLYKPPEGMETKPAGLDWDKYIEPLGKRPWDPKVYFNRFAYWDISTGGQTGGLFVHLVDVAHWYLNLEKPLAAVAGGGIYQYDDGRDTPDTVNLICEYPGLTITFEATLSCRENAGLLFLGSGGTLDIFRSGYTFRPRDPKAEAIRGEATPLEPNHLKNWLECMRSRQRPNADEVSGHYSAMPCHMGNLAYKRQARITWRQEWNV
jgi:predicted dehydrogenase